MPRVHPRPCEPVTASIPTDAAIDEVAAIRDVLPEALPRFYLGQGLRVAAADLPSAPPPPWLRRPSATTRRALADTRARRGMTSHSRTAESFGDPPGEP